MPSFFSVGFGGNARRTAAQEKINKKSSESKRQQSPDEKGISSTLTTVAVEAQTSAAEDGSWVILHDNGGRPFWWHARTGQWAYLPNYAYGNATPSATGYNYLPHRQHQHQHYQQPPLMYPQHTTGHPAPAPVVSPGFYYNANAPVASPLWVVSPSPSPVVVPVVPVTKSANVEKSGKGEGEATARSEEVRSKRAQAQEKQGSKQEGQKNGGDSGRKPWGPTWEKFYGEDGRPVWIHSVSGKLRKTDPYV